MADIDIVPKHSSRAWIWVILVVALVVLAFWFMRREPARSTSVERGGALYAMNQPGPIALTPQPAELAG